jgi:hypothetical protein
MDSPDWKRPDCHATVRANNAVLLHQHNLVDPGLDPGSIFGETIKLK